jgi:hypothetical protein
MRLLRECIQPNEVVQSECFIEINSVYLEHNACQSPLVVLMVGNKNGRAGRDRLSALATLQRVFDQRGL